MADIRPSEQNSIIGYLNGTNLFLQRKNIHEKEQINHNLDAQLRDVGLRPAAKHAEYLCGHPEHERKRVAATVSEHLREGHQREGGLFR